MDILSAAQQQINDAAKTFDPNASSGSAPPSPPPDQPIPTGTPAPLLKEEAILPSAQENTPIVTPATSPTPAPIIDDPLPPAPPPSPPAFEPSLSDAGDATKTFGGLPPEDSWENKAPPPQKKGVGKGVILAGLFLLLATLPVAVYYVSQQQKQIAEIRSRAACGGGCRTFHGPSNCVCRYAPYAGNCYCGDVKVCEPACSTAAPAPTTAPSTPSGGGSTVGVPNGINSGCCPNDSQCVGWYGAGSTCSNPNGACASGTQCRGGANTSGSCHSCLQSECGVPGCGGQTCNAGCALSNPNHCGNGICEINAKPPEDFKNCPQDCKPPTSGTCGANGQPCCDPFSTGGKICDAYCNTATGKCQSTPPGNLCQSGAIAGTKCAVFTCGNKCNNGNQCNLNEQTVDCSAASLGGQCGQIDFLDTKNGYCGVQSQNCGGACAGGVTTAAGTPSGPTSAPGAQCVRIRVYQGTTTTAIDPTTLKAGNTVTLAVAGTNTSKGRIRVNGATFTETTTKNTNDEFTVPFTVPSGITSFTIEAEVFGPNGQWQ